MEQRRINDIKNPMTQFIYEEQRREYERAVRSLAELDLAGDAGQYPDDNDEDEEYDHEYTSKCSVEEAASLVLLHHMGDSMGEIQRRFLENPNQKARYASIMNAMHLTWQRYLPGSNIRFACKAQPKITKENPVFRAYLCWCTVQDGRILQQGCSCYNSAKNRSNGWRGCEHMVSENNTHHVFDRIEADLPKLQASQQSLKQDEADRLQAQIDASRSVLGLLGLSRAS